MFLLQRRATRTAAALAEELEISVRTLYRDVASLVAAGVPVVTSAGPGGGIGLPPTWRTRLDGLTGDEASALLFAGVPQALGDLGMFGAAVAAKAKLAATLPPDLQARIDRVSDRFFLDAPGWFAKKEPLDHLPLVARAVWESRTISVRYGAGAWTAIAPLGLVLKAGIWYVVAEVARTREIRSLRVAKLVAARLGRATVARPAGFSLAAHWARAAHAFEGSLLVYRCEVRLSRRAFVSLPHVIPQDVIREQLARADPPDDEGFRRVALTLESEEVAASQLLALGDGVEVLAPRDLRVLLHDLAARVCARNVTSKRRGPSARPRAYRP